MFDGINSRIILSFYLLQGRQDDGQRRTDIMGGIDEELHLLLIHLSIGSATITIDHQTDEAGKNQGIQAVSPCGTIPGWRDFDGNGLRGRAEIPCTCPNLNRIGTRLQMTQLDDVHTLRILHPIATADTVFIEKTTGIVEVEQRELQCQLRFHI